MGSVLVMNMKSIGKAYWRHVRPDGEMGEESVYWNLIQVDSNTARNTSGLKLCAFQLTNNNNNKIFINSCKVLVLPKPSPQIDFTEESVASWPELSCITCGLSYAILSGNFNLSTFS